MEGDALGDDLWRADDPGLLLHRLLEGGDETRWRRLAVLPHVAPRPPIGAEELPEVVVPRSRRRHGLLPGVGHSRVENQHALLTRRQPRTVGLFVNLGELVPPALDEAVVHVPEDAPVAAARDRLQRGWRGDGLPHLIWIQRSRHQGERLHGGSPVGYAGGGKSEELALV